MLLVANFANAKLWKNHEKLLKPWQTGPHLRVFRESYPESINMTGFRLFTTMFTLNKVTSALERVKTITNLIGILIVKSSP